MAKEKRNLVEDMLFLRVKWNPGSEYPLKAQEAWLEAVERAIEAEAAVEKLTQELAEKDKEIMRLNASAIIAIIAFMRIEHGFVGEEAVGIATEALDKILPF